MPVKLTDTQQDEIDRSRERPAEVVDPRSNRQYVLLPLEEYEAMRDEQEQAALRKASTRTLGRRLAEGE